MFIEYLKEIEQNPNKYDISNLRTGIMAGSLCPTSLMEDVVEKMNMTELTICYGMTETSPVSFQTRPDDSFHDRCSTVGTVHPFLEAKVINKK